jgi:hypothetical protein
MVWPSGVALSLFLRHQEFSLRFPLAWVGTERLYSGMMTEPPELIDRIRRCGSTSSVQGSLPVLFFGDLPNARVATIGINPSHQEYLDKSRNELTGAKRRFETLASLCGMDLATLSNDQCRRVIARMCGYFNPDRPVYSWFRGYERVMNGLGISYVEGSAAHLDLVQEATDPAWRDLNDPERAALLAADQPFLRWQIQTYPLSVVICTSSLVRRTVCDMLDARPARSGRACKRSWSIAQARISTRTVAVIGWDRPLAQAPGLTREEQTALGRTLREELAAFGCAMPE